MPTQFLTNSKSLAARQRFRGKQVDAALKVQAERWGQQVKDRAVALSMGTRTTAELRQYRPGLYSTARPANPQFDAVVNLQSGRFANSWKVRVLSLSDRITVTVLNDSPEAAYMNGTVFMRQRPILQMASSPGAFTKMMLKSKRQAEASAGASSLGMELANVALTVGAAYGGAAMGG